MIDTGSKGGFWVTSRVLFHDTGCNKKKIQLAFWSYPPYLRTQYISQARVETLLLWECRGRTWKGWLVPEEGWMQFLQGWLRYQWSKLLWNKARPVGFPFCPAHSPFHSTTSWCSTWLSPGRAPQSRTASLQKHELNKLLPFLNYWVLCYRTKKQTKTPCHIVYIKSYKRKAASLFSMQKMQKHIKQSI